MLAEELVLVHGWGMNAAVWQPFLPYLEEYRVTRVELPGHGEQLWSAAERDLQSWGDAVLAQAPERAIWCGWSLGGQVALQAALNQPERVSALVLMASTPCFVQHPGWDHAMAADTLAQFARQLHQDVAATLNRFLTLQVRGSADMRPTLNLLRTALAERTPARREVCEARSVFGAGSVGQQAQELCLSGRPARQGGSVRRKTVGCQRQDAIPCRGRPAPANETRQGGRTGLADRATVVIGGPSNEFEEYRCQHRLAVQYLVGAP